MDLAQIVPNIQMLSHVLLFQIPTVNGLMQRQPQRHTVHEIMPFIANSNFIQNTSVQVVKVVNGHMMIKSVRITVVMMPCIMVYLLVP